jgi:hypothetical protein
VIEMVVVSFLMVLLSTIISSIWSVFCLPALDVAARCQMVQEANLAASSLGRDCGGYFSEPSGYPSTLRDYRYNGCAFNPDGSLQINFQPPSANQQQTPPVIIYKLNGNQLVKSYDAGQTWTTIATGLTAFTQADPVDGDPGVAVLMTFQAQGRKSQPNRPNQGFVATYILVTPAADPAF